MVLPKQVQSPIHRCQSKLNSWNDESLISKKKSKAQVDQFDRDFFDQLHMQSQTGKATTDKRYWDKLALDTLSRIHAPTKEKELISFAIIEVLAYYSKNYEDNLSSISIIAKHISDHVMRATNGDKKLAAIAASAVFQAGFFNGKNLSPPNIIPCDSRQPNFETDSAHDSQRGPDDSVLSNPQSMIRSIERRPCQLHDDIPVMNSLSKLERGIMRNLSTLFCRSSVPSYPKKNGTKKKTTRDKNLQKSQNVNRVADTDDETRYLTQMETKPKQSIIETSNYHEKAYVPGLFKETYVSQEKTNCYDEPDENSVCYEEHDKKKKVIQSCAKKYLEETDIHHEHVKQSFNDIVKRKETDLSKYTKIETLNAVYPCYDYDDKFEQVNKISCRQKYGCNKVNHTLDLSEEDDAKNRLIKQTNILYQNILENNSCKTRKSGEIVYMKDIVQTMSSCSIKKPVENVESLCSKLHNKMQLLMKSRATF